MLPLSPRMKSKNASARNSDPRSRNWKEHASPGIKTGTGNPGLILVMSRFEWLGLLAQLYFMELKGWYGSAQIARRNSTWARLTHYSLWKFCCRI